MIKGIYTAIVTPFKESSVDFEAFKGLIKRQLESNVGGILIGGTTGESVNLTLEELYEMVKFAKEMVGNKMEIMLGIGKNSTLETIKIADKTASWPIDSYLVVAPYYNKPTQKGLLYHFKSIADTCKHPVVLYNVPGRTACNIAVDTVLELSEHKNIVGIKEASGNLSQISEIVFKSSDDFYIYSGDDALTYSLLGLGIDGVISVVSNIIPYEFNKMVEYGIKGNFDLALDIHKKYIKLMEAMFIETNPIPVKECLGIMGLCDAKFRLPMCNAKDSTLKILKELLMEYSLI